VGRGLVLRAGRGLVSRRHVLLGTLRVENAETGRAPDIAEQGTSKDP
jgi:hypothetical protein